VVEARAKIERLGARVLVVSFTGPEKVRVYVEKYPLPFPVVSDPRLKAYRAFALGRAPIGSFFRPGVLWHFVKLLFRGWRPRRPGKGDDILQLGGDFVLDPEQRLVYAHPSRDAADRPTATALIAEVAKTVR
jgi:peroxiredoxin